jgi:hypothetical protein
MTGKKKKRRQSSVEKTTCTGTEGTTGLTTKLAAIMSCQSVSGSESPKITTNRVLDRFPKLLRRFYEPLVLSVLNPVRGIRFSNNDYRLDDSLDELRRSFINGLATICDSHKGGDTVTAAALQSTPQQTKT